MKSVEHQGPSRLPGLRSVLKRAESAVFDAFAAEDRDDLLRAKTLYERVLADLDDSFPTWTNPETRAEHAQLLREANIYLTGQPQWTTDPEQDIRTIRYEAIEPEQSGFDRTLLLTERARRRYSQRIDRGATREQTGVALTKLIRAGRLVINPPEWVSVQATYAEAAIMVGDDLALPVVTDDRRAAIVADADVRVGEEALVVMTCLPRVATYLSSAEIASSIFFTTATVERFGRRIGLAHLDDRRRITWHPGHSEEATRAELRRLVAHNGRIVREPPMEIQDQRDGAHVGYVCVGDWLTLAISQRNPQLVSEDQQRGYFLRYAALNSWARIWPEKPDLDGLEGHALSRLIALSHATVKRYAEMLALPSKDTGRLQSEISELIATHGEYRREAPEWAPRWRGNLVGWVMIGDRIALPLLFDDATTDRRGRPRADPPRRRPLKAQALLIEGRRGPLFHALPAPAKEPDPLVEQPEPEPPEVANTGGRRWRASERITGERAPCRGRGPVRH